METNLLEISMESFMSSLKQIKTPSFWVNNLGEHPDMYTVLYEGNIVEDRGEATSGKWVFADPDMAIEAASFIRTHSRFNTPFILMS